MYEYVDRRLVKPYKKECDLILRQTQNDLRVKYGLRFQPVLIGSGAKGLVTRDGDGPFDLDYNLLFASVPDTFSKNPGKLKDTVRFAVNRVIINYGFASGKDSTSAITYLKLEDGRVKFSFDIALILKGRDGKPDSRLIHDKHINRYVWNEIRGSEKTAARVSELKKAGRSDLVRERYLYLKNRNLSDQSEKSSYIIYIEAVNLARQIYMKEVRKMSKVSGNTHTQSQMNHHANQGNPNNAAHRASQNNHSNQGNPNNSAYHSSRSGGKK